MCTADFEDLELASELLPLDYENIDSDAEVPAKYKEIGAQLGNYNLVLVLINAVALQ